MLSPIPICSYCLSMLESPRDDDVRRILDPTENQQQLEFAVSLWYYDRNGPVKTLHQRLKYREGYRLGQFLGRCIARQLLTAANESRRNLPDVVIPVPLHPIRVLERGFNQAEALAVGISSELGAFVSADVLSRKHLSRSQVRLSRAERLENLSNAFAIRRGDTIRGLHVLIVDDVITTGATMLAAIRTLTTAPISDCSVASLGLVRLK